MPTECQSVQILEAITAVVFEGISRIEYPGLSYPCLSNLNIHIDKSVYNDNEIFWML